MTLKFWYSEKHAAHIAKAKRHFVVEVNGIDITYSAVNHPDAEEPFAGAYKMWPDYQLIGLADHSKMKVG